MAGSDDEYYTVPIKDQRVFGAGIKRKRVPFVAASESLPAQPSSTCGLTVAQRYLATVGLADDTRRSASAPPAVQDALESKATTCGICKLRIEGDDVRQATRHESSLAHQICLQHSHGASHIDRTRKGLSFLQAYGWDPDSRQGLGSSGEGRLYPIKPKEKRDTAGLGVDFKMLKAGKLPKKPAERLNAKQVRKQEEDGRKRKERLQRIFTTNDDVVKYLGELG